GAIAGAFLALAGVGIIFSERLTVSPSHVPAMLSILGSAIGFALSNFIMKVKTGDVKPLQSSVLFFISMSILFWIASPCEAPAVPSWPPPVVPTYALVYLALGCSALALPAFFYLLKRTSLMFASTLAFVHPVIALVTDSVFEQQFILTLSAYTGITVVMMGVVLTAMSNEKIREHKRVNA
ncbi:MAG: EamA family transporter, partial [Cyanobacteria bacterium]|nr:EamA family transporter [Cyanobacteriota bacterium]